MSKTKLLMVTLAAILAGGVQPARAQGTPESKAFASVEFGAQPTQRTIETSTSFPLYDETATVNTSQPIHNGPVFGASGGYRIRPTLGVAAGFTLFSARTSDAVVNASIPDLFYFNRPNNVTGTAAGLKHRELGIHFQAVWFHPLTDKFEVVLAGGPSLFSVSHDLATATVAAGTQSISTSVASESKTGLGFNVGGEGNYRLAPRYLVGIFVRYAGASIDLPQVSDLKVGGLQAGLGLRLRF